MLVAVDDEKFSPYCRGSLITNALTQTTRAQCTCRNRADDESKTHLHNTKLGLRARVNAFSAHRRCGRQERNFWGQRQAPRKPLIAPNRPSQRPECDGNPGLTL